jgi:hypothetical protein
MLSDLSNGRRLATSVVPRSNQPAVPANSPSPLPTALQHPPTISRPLRSLVRSCFGASVLCIDSVAVFDLFPNTLTNLLSRTRVSGDFSRDSRQDTIPATTRGFLHVAATGVSTCTAVRTTSSTLRVADSPSARPGSEVHRHYLTTSGSALSAVVKQATASHTGLIAHERAHTAPSTHTTPTQHQAAQYGLARFRPRS